MKKRVLFIVMCTVGFIMALYLNVSLFFLSHFFPGTEVWGKDVSMKEVKKIEEVLQNKIKEYQLTVTGYADGKLVSEEISAEDISLSIQPGASGHILRRQNAFAWPLVILRREYSDVDVFLKWDEEALKDRINSLRVFEEGKEGPVSSSPLFDGEKYVASCEKYGISMEKTTGKIQSHIEKLKSEINLEKEGCLIPPEYTSRSPEIKSACDEMNRYCSASVTYQMDTDVKVEAEEISKWIDCSSDLTVSLQEEKVWQWMRQFGERYDTKGKTRTIVTPWNKTIEVAGGTYGWVIDEETETQTLIESIRKGETVVKEPACVQKADSFGMQDWGWTYLEVDLTEQHMWYMKDGNIVLESDVVTGESVENKKTPTGVYSVLYTQQNATLVGEPHPVTGEPIYRTEVRYWMPFTQQGHGFHDADWQTAFGGDVYINAGSHGCVNMPVDKAGELYALLEAGTPVIIHD